MTKQKAILLPETNEETTETVDTVRDSIQHLLNDQDTQISQAQVARETGISPAALSAWLKGTYKGDNRAVEEKLQIWLLSRNRRSIATQTMPTAPLWIDTPTARKVFAVLAFAQMAGDLGCVYGGAGLGKTVTLRAYAEQNPNVWVVTMSPAHAGVSGALEEIAETIGLRGIPGRAARLQRELTRRLQGTGGLLIIDEAQHLGMRCLESIRALHDATGVGVVLCGNESVFARLTGGSREATFAQLFSRLGKRLRLTHPTKGDVDAMADYFQVKGSEERRMLAEIAGKPGALRGVVKTLRLSVMFAAGEGQPLGAHHIRAAWRDLGGEG